MEALDIVKGKRTKRQRLQSPIPFSVPASSYSGDGYESDVTPPNSAESLTEEEEDLANCLILLAQGRLNIHREKPFNFPTKRFDVYRCKTCDRPFGSFQALGGHRASHRKPKSTTTSLLSNQEVRFLGPIGRGTFYCNPTRSLSHKIHECTICGAEFMSGQALGGHMRRHRADRALLGFELEYRQEVKKMGILLSLDLDLNLPAPESDQ